MSESRRELVRYGVVFILLMVIVLGGVHILRATLRTKYPLMVVVSQSMVPTLGVGDFIFVGHIDDFNEVNAATQPDGDILVFVRSKASEEYIVHRAVKKVQINGEWQFVTKGDNNPVSDGRPILKDQIIGKVVGRVPILGYFPLFIKTSRGLLLVSVLMIIVFFADYLMPIKKEAEVSGRFPWISLLPFLAAPIAYISFWFIPSLQLTINLFTLACWYIGCFLSPLAFGDDDLCLMFWLYYFVLLMVPLGCDIVWWLTGISPSMWWYVQGSTVPVTWLLAKETPLFYRAFNAFIRLLMPGSILFLVTMLAKRRGISILVSASRWMRSSRSIIE